MDTLLRERIIFEIDSFFASKKEKSGYFLNYISLAKEKNLLDKDFFEFYFIKAVSYGVEQDINMISYFDSLFGINPVRAGLLLQKYVMFELTGQYKMTSGAFLIMDKVVENGINSGVVFEETFLCEDIIINNMSINYHAEILAKNRENNSRWLNNKLNNVLPVQQAVTENLVKV